MGFLKKWKNCKEISEKFGEKCGKMWINRVKNYGLCKSCKKLLKKLSKLVHSDQTHTSAIDVPLNTKYMRDEVSCGHSLLGTVFICQLYLGISLLFCCAKLSSDGALVGPH